MVTYILGKSFRGNALVSIALTRKFAGLGKNTAEKICAKLGFYPAMRMHQLGEKESIELSKELNTLKLDSALKNIVRENIAIKRETGSYAGRRHASGFPVNGQRTKTNARTARKFNKVNRVL